MSFLDLVFPKTCLGCGKTGVYICSLCLEKVDLLKPVCPYCERPSIDGFTHLRCRKKLGLDGLVSIWSYNGIVRKAIMGLKYKYATDIVSEIVINLISELHKNNVEMLLPQDFQLIPIPLYWYKKNNRGFNQAEIIGKSISTNMNWDYDPNIIIRSKATTAQSKLSVAERKSNLKKVFMVTNKCKPKIILFDDVFTTGSTLNEACKVLKKSGTATVWGLTIAR